MSRIFSSRNGFNIKVALSQSSISDLLNWNKNFDLNTRNSNPKLEDISLSNALNDLRIILGKITNEIHQVSNLIRSNFREGFAEQQVITAQELLPFIDNFENLANAIGVCSNIVKNIPDRNIQDPESDDYAKEVNNKKSTLLSFLSSIKNTSITERHKEIIRKLASRTQEATLEKMEEYDEARQAMIQEKTMYSVNNEQQLTLKVIREVLQNSGDAVFKKLRSTKDPYSPTIEITTARFRVDNKMMIDIIFKDNGVGMDLKTLREKFFVWFASGKTDDKEATGGIGIGKRLILNTPQHGWSVQTNGIFSNKVLRDFYLSRYKNESEEELDKYFPKIESTGTTLALYNLPNTYDDNIKELCSNFAITSKLKIYVDKELIKPKFILDNTKELDASGDVLANAVGENGFQKEEVKKIVQSDKSFDSKTLGGLEFKEGNNLTTIKFYLIRKKYGGNVYYMINGQYQFEENAYIPQADIVCNVQTNTRPGDMGYPTDQSRDKLRNPYHDKVKSTIDGLKKLLTNISESQIFKSGLSMYVANIEKDPITLDPYSYNRQENALAEEFSRSMSGNSELFKNEDKTEEISKEEAIRKLDEALESIGVNRTEQATEQLKIINNTKSVLQSMESEKITIKDIDQVIDGLLTPCIINVQNGFVTSNLANSKLQLTSNITILWKSILEVIINRTNMIARREETYVPGLIYSDKALALYSPPAVNNRTYHCLSINPINIAYILYPQRFNNVILSNKPETFSDRSKWQKESEVDMSLSDTPTKKLARFLYHSAVHEVTHFLFPDYGDKLENFHTNISSVEDLCNPLYNDIILKLVKKYMPGIKENCRDLITEMKKEMKTQPTQTNTEAKSIIIKKIILSKRY